jgi:hypothetical protein
LLCGAFTKNLGLVCSQSTAEIVKAISQADIFLYSCRHLYQDKSKTKKREAARNAASLFLVLCPNKIGDSYTLYDIYDVSG